jgi:hypothetical protein
LDRSQDSYACDHHRSDVFLDLYIDALAQSPNEIYRNDQIPPRETENVGAVRDLVPSVYYLIELVLDEGGGFWLSPPQVEIGPDRSKDVRYPKIVKYAFDRRRFWIRVGVSEGTGIQCAIHHSPTSIQDRP